MISHIKPTKAFYTYEQIFSKKENGNNYLNNTKCTISNPINQTTLQIKANKLVILPPCRVRGISCQIEAFLRQATRKRKQNELDSSVLKIQQAMDITGIHVLTFAHTARG